MNCTILNMTTIEVMDSMRGWMRLRFSCESMIDLRNWCEENGYTLDEQRDWCSNEPSPTHEGCCMKIHDDEGEHQCEEVTCVWIRDGTIGD
jgi:hypothetical protein